jgi:hypothetical protein
MLAMANRSGRPLRQERFRSGSYTGMSSYVTFGILTMISGYQCAGCGEWNETQVDSSAGMRQSYVEDCQVCCKPNILRVVWDMSAGEYTIHAELE